MDFSKLIGKEIQKKKKQGAASGRRRFGKDKAVAQVEAAEGESEQAETPTAPATTSANPEAKEPPQGKGIAETTAPDAPAPGPKAVVEPVPQPEPESEPEPLIPYSQDEINLASELPLAEINAKLASFNELDNEENISVLAKVRKLGILLRKQKKDLEYKQQLDKENELEMDLLLEEIGDDKFQDKHYYQLRKYIKYLVKCWETAIANAAEGDPRVPVSSSLLLESKRDLVPLLYKLRKRTLKPSMFISLTTIVYYLQQQNFKMANETYLKLSIGNAAWPVGVRSVGIHQRAADSKITGVGKKSAANIMMGDSTRRWITAVKRLITFCENSSKGKF